MAQIVELVKKTVKKNLPRPGAQRGGRDTRIQVREQVPRFSPEQVAAEFDKIFAEMFPGEAVNEDDFEAGLVEAQRPHPFQFAGWREVGVTTMMVSTFCDRHQISLKVLYRNAVIHRNEVVSQGSQDAVIVYHICGDHAYFYEDHNAKNGAARLREGPAKIIVKSEALVKLRTRADDDDQTPFSEMVE